MLDWASGAKVAVIPFGGGSSVVGGVEPAVGGAYSGAVSLDLRRLNRVLEVDTTSRAARIQGGIRGPAIEAALKPMASPSGTIRRALSSRRWAVGSRRARRALRHALHPHRRFRRKPPHDHAGGCDGVAPPARFRRGPQPGPHDDRLRGRARRDHRGLDAAAGRPRFRGDAVFGFPDFFAAARAVRAVAQAGLYPSNLRVIDNDEAGAYGVNAYEESLLVLAFESADHPVDAWMARAIELLQTTAAVAIPTRTRLPLAHGFHPHALRARIDRADGRHQRHVRERDHLGPVRGLPRRRQRRDARGDEGATGNAGTVSTRFTHVYPDGPAVYYTFNVRGDLSRLIEQWRHIKTRASDALIAAGGTITHHHAVGRDHMPWYRAQRPALFGKALAAAKSALDPAGIMNPGVIVP